MVVWTVYRTGQYRDYKGNYRVLPTITTIYYLYLKYATILLGSRK